MADESGSSEGKPVKRRIMNRLTQEQVGKLTAYIFPRKAEFTGKMCRDIASVCSQELGFRVTKDNIHSVAGYVDLKVAEPGIGNSKYHRLNELTEVVKKQAEAIEQLKIQVKLLEESLQAHSHVPTAIRDLTKTDIELGSRLDILHKRVQSVAPIKPV